MFEIKLSTIFENTFKNKHLEGSHVIFMSHICTKYKGSLERSSDHLFYSVTLDKLHAFVMSQVRAKPG